MRRAHAMTLLKPGGGVGGGELWVDQLCTPLNPYVEALISSVMDFGGGNPGKMRAQPL